MSAEPTRVLVAEDEPAHAEAIRRSLEEVPGLELRTVASLRGFRREAAAWSPHIALVDLNLSDGKATELLADPAGDPPFPMIVMTSRGDQQTAVAAMRAGALDYLVKSPETFLTLPQTLERLLREWAVRLDRRQAEQALRLSLDRQQAIGEELERSKELLRQVLDTLPLPVFCKDPEGRYSLCNRAFLEFLGRAEAEVLGRTAYDIAPAALAEVYRQEDLLLTGDRDRQYEGTVLAASGARQVLFSKKLMRDAAGRATGLVGAILDITDRKFQEDAREQTARLIAMVNSAGDLRALLRDLTGALRDWSGCEAVGIRLADGGDFPYYETRGFPAAFIQSESRLCVPGPDGRPLRDAAGEPVLECMCGNVLCGRCDPALPFFTANGSFWTNSTTTLLAGSSESERQGRTRNRCNASGYESVALIPLGTGQEVLGLLQFNDRRKDRFSPELIAHFEALAGTMAAGLARRRAEDELRESEARFRSLTELSPDAIWVNRNDRIVLVNSEGLRLLGADSADQVLGRDPFELFHPDCHDRVRARLEAALGGRVVRHSEETVVRLDGAARQVSVSSAPFDDAQGPAIQTVLRDTTEQRRAEREKAAIQAQLQQAQKMESLGTLVAGVAHNLNHVLAIVMGTASLREQMVAEPADREAYLNIGKVCRRGREVVRSLIRFAQPALSSQAPFELHDLIREVLDLLESTARNRVRIVHAFAPGPLWISGDAGSINHALMNLGINALDAMPQGGTLTLRTAGLAEGWAEITVEDDGAGMAPEVLAHVMEPFFTTKEVGRGTGLGLSMTYGVVKAHGGTIHIASLPGQGTTVRVRLPVIQAPAPGAAASAPAPVLGAMTVFLVDDEEDVRFLMTRMLKKAGVRQVTTFAGGEAALRELSAGTLPDLVILDQNMPGLSGVQTMDRIRALHPGLPILISSGQPDIEDWADFRQARVGVISKPFNMEEIQAKLAQFARA